MTNTSGSGHLSPEEIREKYRIEREKRLRADGTRQFKAITGEFADFDRDPFSDPNFTRPAVTEEVEVVIVGAGFGGMLAAYNLQKAGITNFRMIDLAGDFGGTWYWNRYPNCACDVESYVYLPLLEETGYMPTEKYVKAYEIFAYCQLLGRTLDLYPRALFQTEVDDMRWDDTTQRWHTITSRGDDLTSKFVIIAGGVLHRPKLPAVEGIHKFKGRAFHTSRWDYSYTGGSPTEFMDKLADKRVAIIGTGATAVQAVPKLAEACKELYVFQRTPALVGKRNNKPTDPEWFASLKPGWQAERIKNFTLAITGSQPEVDMVADEWTKLFWVDTRKLPDDEQEAIELEKVDFDNVQKIRDHIANVITDQELAKKLMPWYSQACKRPCFHDEYLPAFNRSNVHLVDTDGKGIHELGENGPIFEGREYPVDLLIYASGYEVTNDYHERLGFDPKGRGGTPLSVAWADGPSTLQGVLTRGFPNMLMISTVQGAQATNFLHSISTVAEHVAWIIAKAKADGIATMEPVDAAQEEWFQTLLVQVFGIARYNAVCTPGYLNREGEGGDMTTARSMAWMTSVMGFIDYVEAWRARNDFAGLEVHPG
ncbi:MAG: flavin-containing monooxygenase [Ilumatobacteraceae bacterium]